ncbi:TlpA family protein disulfide reductase [Rhizosphaericola mali]|uniref:Redoxin domain-containing protein n=1 Tax=Rhizosphaericola mali TaxID=2545455 RepID=A0A5P2G0M4_9BACT|nr:redoxin domain-containing protein [Rhizosphaericola mali]QES87370.1 redoxin domain-containing protein [Rhizosphaericola mali]
MNLKTILIVMGMLLPIHSVSGQEIKPLTIGDTVPDFELPNVINYKDSVIHLHDFQGKLVILDFYGTWCGGCQPGIPKLDSLQKVFKDKIQVIVLCHDENLDIVHKTIQNRWKEKNLILPFVLAKDPKEYINQLFPHKMVPHEIWISPDRILVSTTGADEVSYKNIRTLLNGSKPVLQIKKDLLDFDKNKALLENPEVLNNLKYSSLFTKHISGAGAAFGRQYDSSTRKSRYYYINLSPILLLRLAFGCDLENRVSLECSNPTAIYSPSYSRQWRNLHTFCYEQTIINPAKNFSRKQLMQSDLTHFLGLSVIWEQKLVPCWVLKKSHNSGNEHYSPKNTSRTEFISYHGTGSQIIHQLAVLDSPVLIDETNSNRILDFQINRSDIKNIHAIRTAFNSNNIHLQKQYRKINMLIIRDTPLHNVHN